MRAVPLLLLLALGLPTAAAHGDLEINELETLIIRDFEGHEDSFAWEGFEIWDVYAGEGHNATLGSDGVYFKVNLAGDGTARPTGGRVWTLTFTFTVGDEPFERVITHDGADVTTTFESLQWLVADGNVAQVKAWTPVADWTGKTLKDVVIVSSVDGKPRDTAPGGVHDPATGRERPVEAPSTFVFPPMGEGRIVEEVALSGPGKYLDLAVTPLGDGAFTLVVTNPLEKQGQHVMLDAKPSAGWELATSSPPHSLDGGKSATFDIRLNVTGAPGDRIEPYAIDLLTDIGGRKTLYATLGPEGVLLVDAPAGVATIPDTLRPTPLPVWLALAAVLGALPLRRK